MGQVDFHICFRGHGCGGGIVEGDGADGSCRPDLRRREDLLGTGVVVVVAQREVRGGAVRIADDAVCAFRHVLMEDVGPAHRVEPRRRGVDVQADQAVTAEIGLHHNHKVAVGLVGGVDGDAVAVFRIHPDMPACDRDGDMFVLLVWNHRGFLFQAEVELVVGVVLRHHRELVEHHGIHLRSLHDFGEVAFEHAGCRSRIESGVVFGGVGGE